MFGLCNRLSSTFRKPVFHFQRIIRAFQFVIASYVAPIRKISSLLLHRRPLLNANIYLQFTNTIIFLRNCTIWLAIRHKSGMISRFIFRRVSCHRQGALPRYDLVASFAESLRLLDSCIHHHCIQARATHKRTLPLIHARTKTTHTREAPHMSDIRKKNNNDFSLATNALAEIILHHDNRGMKSLVEQGHVPGGGYFAAADMILAQPRGTCLIVTGSYIPAIKATETDGPPGAAVLGHALTRLGFTPVFVTDKYSYKVMAACVRGTESRVLLFPHGDLTASIAFANGLLEDCNPALLCSVERLGRGSDGKYRNMLGEDVSCWNDPVDVLFDDLNPKFKLTSIGIFDGGNEVGCGSLVMSGVIPSANPAKLLTHGSVIDTTIQVAGATSNWGAFGVVTALALTTGDAGMLPNAKSTWDLTRQALHAGAVDGIRHGSASVDGHDEETNLNVVEKLHELLRLYG